MGCVMTHALSSSHITSVMVLVCFHLRWQTLKSQGSAAAAAATSAVWMWPSTLWPRVQKYNTGDEATRAAALLKNDSPLYIYIKKRNPCNVLLGVFAVWLILRMWLHTINKWKHKPPPICKTPFPLRIVSTAPEQCLLVICCFIEGPCTCDLSVFPTDDVAACWF